MDKESAINPPGPEENWQDDQTMSPTPRVRRLRQQSLDAVPSISTERAVLMTEFCRQNHGMVSTPVYRAMAFRHLMENEAVCILDDELIVGEKGPSPKATPTYPELCCHSLQDFDILDSREKTPFAVDETARREQAETVIPFWEGRSMRDLILAEMTPEWHDAYEAGVFTEFMEQRSPGHTVLDDKIYRKGMLDFIEDIGQALASLDFIGDPAAYQRQEQLKAMRITAEAIITFGRRHAEEARRQAGETTNPQRKAELAEIARICDKVPAHRPDTFHEALQYYWFVHLGVTTELNPWDAFNPGRLDQHLHPYYRHETEAGTLNRRQAEELLHCFWIKFNNQPAPPKVGVTAAESGTYTDFAQINTGGVKPDGSSAVNDVTYLLLDVIEEMRLLQPSSSCQLSKKNPDRFMKRAAEILRTGFGQPSIFNTDVVVQEMIRQGKTIEDARNGGTSGCVETGAFGKENYCLTGYFNLPKVLEITLHDGIDPATGKQLGPRTGKAGDFESFEVLFEAFASQVRHFIDIKIRGNQIIEQLYATHLPVPFLSLLIDDCIANGKDYHSGGARYNTSYIQGVGLGSITDSLSAIKHHVFEQRKLPMAGLMQVLAENFEGHERIRQLLLNRTPRYGNDDDAADDIMRQVFEVYFNAVDGRPNAKGGKYRINLLPTTVHVYFGSVIGATADGRHAGKPLSEGISPVQGADRKGPTAVIKSASKMDHTRTGGTLLNQKFTPQLLGDEDGLDKLVKLVRTYFKLDGHHIQFNVVDADTLRKAQANPEEHRDLIVRVAGYSDYFCDLGEALQEEIITRTAHDAF